jgi:regulator of sigma E protease
METITSIINNFPSILHSIAAFIVILTVIVFIHEFGHYYIAKKCGVKIESFSIGFWKEIFGFYDKSGTRWKFCILPLGGYVKMYGDETAASTPDAEKLKTMTPEEKAKTFQHKPVWQRFLIVLGGPLANYILAIIIFAGFFSYYGRPETAPEIGSIVEQSAAAEVGLEIGDTITEFDGKKISRFEDIREIATINPNTPLNIKYDRAGVEHSTTITPKLSETEDIFGNKVQVGLLGIGSGKVVYQEIGVVDSLGAATREAYVMSAQTLKAIGQMIIGSRPADQISGVLRIADYSGKSVDKGLQTVIWFMAILSLNLGLVNLLPIPMLDGGHLVFYTIEGIARRPLPEKMQEYFFRFGFAVLISLMLFATFNDLKYFGLFN